MISFLWFIGGALFGVFFTSLAVAAKIGDEKTEQTVKRVDMKV